MIRHVMRVGLYLLAAVGALYLAMLGMFFFSRNVCEVSPIASFPSPSLKIAVDVQHRSCRGEEMVTTASLRKPLTTSPSERTTSTELWTSPPLADASAATVESSPVQAVWISESTVKVMVPRGTRKAFEREFDGVRIVYEER
jgi:hypothetical protein